MPSIRCRQIVSKILFYLLFLFTNYVAIQETRVTWRTRHCPFRGNRNHHQRQLGQQHLHNTHIHTSSPLTTPVRLVSSIFTSSFFLANLQALEPLRSPIHLAEPSTDLLPSPVRSTLYLVFIHAYISLANNIFPSKTLKAQSSICTSSPPNTRMPRNSPIACFR